MYKTMFFDGRVDGGEDRGLLRGSQEAHESASEQTCGRCWWLPAVSTSVLVIGVVALVGIAMTKSPSEQSFQLEHNQLRSDAKGGHGLSVPADVQHHPLVSAQKMNHQEGSQEEEKAKEEDYEKEKKTVQKEEEEASLEAASAVRRPSTGDAVSLSTTGAAPKKVVASTTAAPSSTTSASEKQRDDADGAKEAEEEGDSKLKVPVLPPTRKCSWSNEDCHETKCCSNIQCDFNFANCQGYQCFKKDDFEGGYAGCKLAAPGGWLGTVLGGAIEPREIKPAPADTQAQGTSLFCFSVVMWNLPPPAGWQDSEAALANNWKRKGAGILECDDHLLVDGLPAPRSGWGSTSNIDVFIKYWQQVLDDGRYKKHDWVVKADADAVFFPARLKLHLSSLRTPRGAKVFLLNNGYKFKFLGALEILTREAADLYFENADRCSSGEGGHSGGEDYYMKSCLVGIGVDMQVDETLLHDKYAAQNGCSDGWASCFHFFKTVAEWDACHAEALSAQKAHDAAWNAAH